MTQRELDAIPEIGWFKREAITGTPGCYRPVAEPVYALADMECYIGLDGQRWLVGRYDGKRWKRRA